MAKNNSAKQVSTGVKYDDPRISHMGTHTDFVKKESNVKFSVINPNININDYIVVAEDQKGLYVTEKSYIDSHVLDPFRMYHRNEYIVKESEDSYTITYIPANTEVTI